MSSSSKDTENKLDLPTPDKCTADFCLIPLGTGSPSVSQQIADVQRLIQRSGVKHQMHSAGTTLGTISAFTIKFYTYAAWIYPSSEPDPDIQRFLLYVRDANLVCVAVEGSWATVTQVIGQCHTLLHNQSVVRIQTDIRIGSRTDKAQTMEEKVEVVKVLLESDSGGKAGSEGT